MHPTRSPRRGGNAVEFALLMPVFLVLVFGTVDYGWVMYHLAALHSAAHHGCRRATLIDPGPGETNLQSVVDTAELAMLERFEDDGPGCPSGGCSTEVQVTGAVPERSIVCRLALPIEPIVGYVSVPVSLQATAVMRLEYQRGG